MNPVTELTRRKKVRKNPAPLISGEHWLTFRVGETEFSPLGNQAAREYFVRVVGHFTNIFSQQAQQT